MIPSFAKHRISTNAVVISATLGIASLAIAAGASAQEFTLRFAQENAQTHPVGQGGEFLAERVAELTDGRVEVRVFHGGELGSAPDVIEAVQLGTLEMATATMGVMANFVPEFDIVSLPFLFRGPDHLKETLEGELGDVLREAAESGGFNLVAMGTSGTRQLYSQEPVRTPEDVQGKKVRVMEVPILIETWRTLGAVATPVSFPEVYMALQTGVVDAAESSFLSWVNSSHYEVAPYGIRINYADAGRVYVMSPETAGRLPEDLLSAVEQATREAADYVHRLYVEGEAEAIKEAAEHGATVIEPDVAAFQEAIQPVYEEFEPTLGMEWVNRIQSE